jgi:hypothetical protein
MAASGPIADAIGLQTAFMAMSAISATAVLAWLSLAGVWRVRRPTPQAAATTLGAQGVERPIVARL